MAILTATEIAKLNKMNVVSEEIQLGTSLGETQVGQAVIFTYDQTEAANAAAQTVLTAPFPMRIIDVLVQGKNAEAAVVTLDNGTTPICTAITAANGALVHMIAGVVDAEMTLATGDVITMQTGAAASRCQVSVICVRI